MPDGYYPTPSGCGAYRILHVNFRSTNGLLLETGRHRNAPPSKHILEQDWVTT